MTLYMNMKKYILGSLWRVICPSITHLDLKLFLSKIYLLSKRMISIFETHSASGYNQIDGFSMWPTDILGINGDIAESVKLLITKSCIHEKTHCFLDMGENGSSRISNKNESLMWHRWNSVIFLKHHN